MVHDPSVPAKPTPPLRGDPSLLGGLHGTLQREERPTRSGLVSTGLRESNPSSLLPFFPKSRGVSGVNDRTVLSGTLSRTRVQKGGFKKEAHTASVIACSS